MLRNIRWEFTDFVWLMAWQHVHTPSLRQCAQKVAIILSDAAATAESVRHQRKPVELISSPLRCVGNSLLSFTGVVNSQRVGTPIRSERISQDREPCSASRPERDRGGKGFNRHLTT
jgi:hypothetical protein